MKKLRIYVLVVVLLIGVLAGCGKKEVSEQKRKSEVITVGASPVPHAKILEYAKKYLKEKGYDLKIVEFTDYVQPNKALLSKELDANYFQHQPYLDDYNQKNQTDILGLTGINYEPLGLYGGKVQSLKEIPEKGKIGVPNDGSNEARALLLLEDAGLIQLKKGVGVAATIKDIVKNPKNLEIIELEAAQLPRSLADLDLAVINGNFALDAGLSVEKDALLLEKSDSVGATKYQNLIAVRKEDQNSEKIKALIEVLTSKDLKDYINQSFEKAVVAK